jgi:hypothetical protein
MACFYLLFTILLGGDFSGLENPRHDLSAYQAAKAQAGFDSEANVRLALWCEAHGMEAERLEHLAIALRSNPGQAAARGLLGLVSYQGDWQTPSSVAKQAESDALLAEYNTERERTPDTADGHWKLALWCEEKGLKPEARAHFTAVTQLAPGCSEAWRRLGCQPYKGQWLSAEQVAAEHAEDELQNKADRYWDPQLETWKKQLWRGGDERKNAATALASVRDPRAVPAIRRFLGKEDPELQLLCSEHPEQNQRIRILANDRRDVRLCQVGGSPEGRSG